MTLRRYRQQNLVPPGGKHFYTVEETGFYFEGHIMDNVVRDVTMHLQANQLPVPTPAELSAIIQDHVCRHTPESFCVGQIDPEHPPKRYLTIAQVRDFTKIISGIGLNAVRGLSENSYVRADEAERRAKICADCPANLQGICTTCNGLAGFAKTLIGGDHRKTGKDPVLHVCENCGCLLRVKVHLSKDILKRGRSGIYPGHCWMNDHE